jgi:hypothetical protein
LVEHADFLREPQRVIERQRVDHGAEAKVLRAHRDGGEKHIGRWRHAKRGAVVFGQVIGVETRAIIGLDQRQPLLHELRHRQRRIIQMIEDPDFHRPRPPPDGSFHPSGPSRLPLSRPHGKAELD